MRNAWKVAVAFTLALGLGGALAQAQPLITGNTAAFGCGPISTSDFTLGTITHQFYPDGAGGANCPDDPPNQHNGRGLAVGGTEVFYTELDEVNPGFPFPGFGGSEFIHVADYNAGAGSGDTRLLPNPRPGSGIQDLTFANGILYVLTGYNYQDPIVYPLNRTTGAVLPPGPVTIARPGFTDDSLDGFAVLPNGNFLANNMATSCIYSEYSSTTGAFIGNTINVPGGPARCTGVDTDGTSLYFLTDFTAITRTDKFGNMNGFNFFDGPGAEDFIEDISLVHPVTSITGVGDGHFFFSLRNTDDIVSKHDFLAELLKNGTVVATGLTRCYSVSIRTIPGHNVPVPISLPSTVILVSGDVLSLRLSTRMGTNPDDTQCPGGHFSNNGGLRFFYDSTATPSQFAMTIFPALSQPYYFHSDGTTCTNALGESQPTATLNRTLSTIAPAVLPVRCKEVPNITFAGGNPWRLFSTWFLAPLD